MGCVALTLAGVVVILLTIRIRWRETSLSAKNHERLQRRYNKDGQDDDDDFLVAGSR